MPVLVLPAQGFEIAWEVLEHLGYRGRIDRLRLGALDEVSIRRAFAQMRKAGGRRRSDTARVPLRPRCQSSYCRHRASR
jgi:hypothetical protein